MLEASFSWYFGIWLKCKTKRHRNPPAVEPHNPLTLRRHNQRGCRDETSAPLPPGPPLGASTSERQLREAPIPASSHLIHSVTSPYPHQRNAARRAPCPFRSVGWSPSHPLTLHTGKQSMRDGGQRPSGRPERHKCHCSSGLF